MSTIGLLLIAAVVILVVIPITVALYRAWKVPKAWDDLRDRRDLENEAGDDEDEPHLAGEIEDRDVEVWVDTDIAADGKSGPPHAHYTNIEVPLTVEDDSEICLQQAGVGDALWRKVMTSPGGFDYKSDEVADGSDPDVDGDDFDARFETAGKLSDALRAALQTSAVQAILDDMLSASSELHIERGTLRFSEPGRISSRARLKRIVDDIVGIGRVLDTALSDYHEDHPDDADEDDTDTDEDDIDTDGDADEDDTDADADEDDGDDPRRPTDISA